MMEIKNSTSNDIDMIFDLYKIASSYMRSKGQVVWPEFSHDLIQSEIDEKRQWKMLIDGEVACIWATTLDDELIWGKKNVEPSVYIHRIATDPEMRGQNFVKKIVAWADQYCLDNKLKYVRLDTVGLNEGLINHYQKCGFEFLGAHKLDNTEGLPAHYKEGPVSLFQREVN